MWSQPCKKQQATRKEESRRVGLSSGKSTSIGCPLPIAYPCKQAYRQPYVDETGYTWNICITHMDIYSHIHIHIQ